MTEKKKLQLKQDELLEMYKNIFEIIYNWIVVVDPDGFITMINERYCDFLGIAKEDALGQHVTDVIENTRMHIVVKTGQREIGDIQQIKGNKMIADRIPIYKGKQVIGAVGTVMFKDVVELDAFVKRVSNIEKELEFYKKELQRALGTDDCIDNIIGYSDSMRKMKNLARQVASTKSNILLLGESGTGKGLLASTIHKLSPRINQPFVKVNCAAIPEELLESELFGYESGAFTGAKKGGKPGKFELAHHGTIFLDEIGELPLSMQAKLLRAIQEKEIDRIGGTQSKKIDVRIIAATNQDLEEMVKRKTFREDLYYRLNVVSIRIPPLRERKPDIPHIANYLLKQFSDEMGKFVTEITPAAMESLKEYDWPGNVRELENIIERAFNFIDKEAVLMLKHLPNYITNTNKANITDHCSNLKAMIEEVEKAAIEKYLIETDGNKYQTAKLLGISRTSLYDKIDKYNLDMSNI